jgi:hypothetical protein
MPIPYRNTAQSLLYVTIYGILRISSPDIMNHHLIYHLQVTHRLRFIPLNPPLAHLPSWNSPQLVRSSSVDVDGSCTASAPWSCIAMGCNYFNTRDSSLVLADTDLYLLNCAVSQPPDCLNIFCVFLAVNHAIVEVLTLIMD